MLIFPAPPFPYVLHSGFAALEVGERHLSRRNLDCFDLIVVFRGRLYMGEESSVWTVEAGEYLILRPDLYHYGADVCEERTEFGWVHFRAAGEWHDEMPKRLPAEERALLALPQKGTVRNLQHTIETLTEIDELQHRGERLRRTLRRQHAFQEMLMLFEPAGLEDQSPLQAQRVAANAANWIEEHYSLPLTAASIGKALNFHPAYVARCMKTTYGLTPLDYVKQVRLRNAQRLLMATDESIDGISERVGYGSNTYFARLFVRQYGMTPSEFRRSYR